MIIGMTYMVPVIDEVTYSVWAEYLPEYTTFNKVDVCLVSVSYFPDKHEHRLLYSFNGKNAQLLVTDEFIVSYQNPAEKIAEFLAENCELLTGLRPSVKSLLNLELNQIEHQHSNIGWNDAGYTQNWDSEYNGNHTHMSLESDNGLANLSNDLPGVKEMVPYPCACHSANDPVRQIIIHLNDQVKWTREQIADWLDELADSGQINIDFQVDSGIGDDLEQEIKDANSN